MVVFNACNPFVFVGGHIAKTVIYIINSNGVAVAKAFGVVGGVGYGLQLVGGVGISEVVNFYGLSAYFFPVTFQRGDIAVFIVAQVFGILSVAGVIHIKQKHWSCSFQMTGMVQTVQMVVIVGISSNGIVCLCPP